MVRLNPLVLIAVMAIGALAAFLGMLDWVGYVSWGISPYALYIGVAMIIAGVVLSHLDIRGRRPLFDDYEAAESIREGLRGVPDDDYCYDMTGGTGFADDTEYCDLTDAGKKEERP